MKIFIALCCFFALTFAEIASSNKYGVHHSQHQQSVDAAKQSLQDRLSAIEDQQGYRYGASGSEKYVVGCSSCLTASENQAYSSRHSSASERRSSALSQGDYAGVGIVGFTDDDRDDVQSVVAPYAGSASERASSRYSSSSNAFEAEDLQQRVVPADLSGVSSSAYRASLAETDEDELQRTLVPLAPVGSTSRLYSQSRGSSASETSRVDAVPVYVSSGSSNLHRASTASQSESELRESRKPIPTGQYVSISARPGTSNVLAVPVRVINTSGVPDDNQKYYSRSSDYSTGSESSNTRVSNPTSTTYRVTYIPSRNYVSSDKVSSSQSESENSRVVGGVQQPERFTGYNTFNAPDSASQTRYRADDSDSYSEQNQVRVAPVSVTYPLNGGSSRYASSGSSSGHTQSRVVPVYPVSTVESSSSALRTAEEREQRRYTPAVPYVSASRVSSSDQEENRNQQSSSQFGTAGTYYVPVGQSRSQTQQQQYGSGSQAQYQRFSPYVPVRTQSTSSGSQFAASDKLSQRFGTGVTSLGQTDDLDTYMTESERLARLQQHQIAGSSSNVALSNSEANRRTVNTASSLDSAAANFVRTSNLANRNSEFDSANADTSGAGFNRVRSWNKQSKWSSGSEYGTDGKPKSYSTLSTAEAEKYNINGAEAGYKAATTTLENDGKVSTYSIHTP